MARIAKGLRSSGNHIRITLYRGGNGKPVYDKTHPLDPSKPADVRRAEKIHDDLDSRLKCGLPISDAPAEKQQFVELAQEYLNSTLVDDNTRIGYKSHLNKHCLPHLGHLIFDEITRKNIVDAVGAWKLKPSSKRTVLSVLSAVFKYGGVSPNPCYGVSVGKDRKGKKERYKPAERDAILKELTGHAHTFFAIFFGCGMRPGEIVALEWADYDGESLWVEKQYTGGRFKGYTKNKEDRRVYVPTWVREVINGHDTRMAGGRMFLTNWYENYYSEWEKAHEKARVGAHRIRLRRPYTCRHTRAAELLSSGVLPAQAAKEMGHSPHMFLVTYAEFIEEYCGDSDMSKLEGIKSKPAKNLPARSESQ